MGTSDSTLPALRIDPGDSLSFGPQPTLPQTGFFAGKVAIVTGSESGIGRETARELCRQGARVVLNGLHADRLDTTRRAFKQAGYTVVSCVADVTDYAQCEALVQKAIQAYGRIDVLITNASISMRAYFSELSHDVFRRVLDSNVYGSVYPLKAALPYLTQSAGVVTFISSISALNGMPSGSAYCAGKAALINLTHTLNLELHETGIRFGVVHLGFTQNDTDKRVLDAAGRPVPIAYRNPRWQMSQCDVAKAILNHIRKRRVKTVLTPTGHLINFMTRFFPKTGDRFIRWSMRNWKKFYE
ncbi:SDR family oxidoreductase [Spirosoma rigui]|uniref:SDR family oxidoreductase n=1 Tax=Spirosoma rigui TaxID=564064 RepID=UPI0009B0112D|nr:SDR family oxidoreductase [Spirosoma rigui]